MNLAGPLLTFMVALNCEAKPWVDFYKLKKMSDKPFALYAREGVNVEVIITGIGALPMSTAVGWASGRESARARVWLNLGIAGHLSREIGDIVRVHSFIDENDLKRHYAPLTAKWSGDIDALMSVNAPTNSYPDKAMVDMEGVAFYKAANMFTPTELIASLKVISDNKDNSVETLNASKISQLMQRHLSVVNLFTANVLALAETTTLKPITLALSGIRMTHSQKQQLNRLLEKASVLNLHNNIAKLNLTDNVKIESILDQLTSLIEITTPLISGVSQAKTRGRNG